MFDWLRPTLRPFALCASTTLLLLASVTSPLAEENAQPSVIGRTSILFNADILNDLGIEVVREAPTAEPYREGGMGFAIRGPAQLLYTGARVNSEGFASGSLTHVGGFALAFDDLELSIQGFELRVGEQPIAFDLYDTNGHRWFRLGSMQYATSPDGSELRLINIDLLLSPEFAKVLGRPDLSNSYLAVIDIVIPADLPQQVLPQGALPLQGLPGSCDPPNPLLDSDVALTGLNSLTQLAREAGGRVAIAPSAQLMNVGTGTVEWGQTIDPDADPNPEDVGPHPYLSLAFYRLANGRLRQLGQSDTKHAFLSINSGCPCPSGQFIYPGCGDVYGNNLNGQRFHLGPRDEVTAHTGAWTRAGSHFDSFDNNTGMINPALTDDLRSHGGEGDHLDSFEHRLFVQEPDLQVMGAQYFTEAWYVVKDDIDIFNSMGNRRVSPSLMGSTWSFAFTSPLENGSILDHFVNPSAPAQGALSTLVDTGEGTFQLAVKTSGEGGSIHYEYALMNFDFDRQISSFTVPLAAGVTVSNPEFNDVDTDAGNQWAVSIVPGVSITWTAPAGNSLDWGTLYNFAFDANTPAIAANVTLTAFEGGAPLAGVASLAPDPSGVPPGPGSNDDCANAQVIGTGTTFGTLESATRDGDSSADPFDSIEPDVWYQFTASRTGEVRFNTCRSNDLPGIDLGIDTIISVHSGCPGSLGNEVAANDDADLIPPALEVSPCDQTDSNGTPFDQGAGLDSDISVMLTQGVTVNVRVSRFDGADEFLLTVLEPPANDDFDSSTLHPGGTVMGSLAQAEADFPVPGTPSQPDVWYRYDPSVTGSIRINTCGSFEATGQDTVMAVFDFFSGNFLADNDDYDFGNDPTACNGPGGSFLDSAVALDVFSLDPLLIQVSRFDDSSEGGFNINVDGNPPFQVTMAADPLSVPAGSGEDSFITWYAFQGGTCVASGAPDFSGTRATNGTELVTPLVSTDYTMTCTQAGFPGNVDEETVSVVVASIPNDSCETPIVVSQAGLPFDEAIDTSLATADMTDPDTSAAVLCSEDTNEPDGATAWYSYTPKSSGTVQVSSLGSDYDTVISVWDAAPGCGNLDVGAPVACNDNISETTFQAELSFDAVMGTSYLIQVGDWAGGPGGRLVLSIPEPGASSMLLTALAALGFLGRSRRRGRR